MWAHAMERKAELMAISEIPRRFIQNETQFRDTRGDAGIVLIDKSKRILESGAGGGFVWIRGKWGTMYSVYISPNSGPAALEVFLADLADSVRARTGWITITGDFNAKAVEWGSPRTDNRGTVVLEWAAELDLAVANDGNPTFHRGETESHLDLTWTNQEASRTLLKWEVLVEESLSDHNAIFFETRDVQNERSAEHGRPRMEDATEESLARELRSIASTADPAVLRDALVRASRRAGEHRGRRRSVYWWNPEVAQARKSCLAARRKATRSRGKENATPLRTKYQEEKKALRKSIAKAKEEAWKDLCRSIEANPWGQDRKSVV